MLSYTFRIFLFTYGGMQSIGSKTFQSNRKAKYSPLTRQVLHVCAVQSIAKVHGAPLQGARFRICRTFPLDGPRCSRKFATARPVWLATICFSNTCCTRSAGIPFRLPLQRKRVPRASKRKAEFATRPLNYEAQLDRSACITCTRRLVSPDCATRRQPSGQ